MLCQRTVEHKTVLPGFQRHGRLLCHLGLQLLHLGGGQVGRVRDDEFQLPLRQRLPVGEQVALHRLHRVGRLLVCPQGVQRRAPVKSRGICLLKGRGFQHILGLSALSGQGAAGILFQIDKGLRAFFHAGHLRGGAKALDPQPQTACPGAQIQHPGRCDARKGLGGGLCHHLGVCPGAEHPGAYRQLKI